MMRLILVNFVSVHDETKFCEICHLTICKMRYLSLPTPAVGPAGYVERATGRGINR